MTGRRGALAAALPLLLAFLASGCAQEEQWNVLLVTFDTTRADRIGAYGNDHIRTPTLDSLGASGTRFAHAYSAVPITAPSHSTIHTGLYPMAHGVRDNGLFVLSEEQETLAEILAARGYETAAAIGAYPLISRFGLAQGFDLYDEHLTGGYEDYLGERATPKQSLFFDERRAAQVNEAMVPWLTENAEKPFFAWVHYFDPHQPFEPPAPYDQLYADDPYDGEIAYADSRLGFLLEHLRDLGVLDRTLVVMTADHGEGLGQHNEETHAILAYDSTLHVPLFVQPPQGMDLPRGRVVDQRVATVDILPTILDLLGVEAPSGLQGRSLVPLMRGETESTRPRPLYAENLSPRLTHGWGELRVLFDGSFKYIHGPRRELFDLDSDPGELRDLFSQQPEKAEEMRRLLESLLERYAVAGSSQVQALDEEVRERLEALGYLHGSGPTEQTISEVLRTDGVAPQDRVSGINDLSAAKHLLFDGHPHRALRYTQKLVDRDPESPLFLELHATALGEVGRLEEARDAAKRLAELASVPERMVLRLASMLFQAGEQDAAISLLESALEDDPGPRVAWLLAGIQGHRGEVDASRRLLERALDLDEHFVPARVEIAVQLARSGDHAAAERQFRRAIEDDPFHAQSFYNYGTFMLHRGRPLEAEEAFSRAISLAPEYAGAHLALVAARIAADEPEWAREAYAELVRIAPQSEAAATAAGLLTMPEEKEESDG